MLCSWRSDNNSGLLRSIKWCPIIFVDNLKDLHLGGEKLPNYHTLPTTRIYSIFDTDSDMKTCSLKVISN